MKKIFGCGALCLIMCQATFSQVDTTFIYNTTMPYGTLDLRIAKSSTHYYYLQENTTFSFREQAAGVKTGTYRDMTAWDSSPYQQGNLREKTGWGDYFVLNYRLLFPGNYTDSYPDGYPLILMMHGAGERANCWDNDCFWDTRYWRPAANSPAAPTTSDHELLNNDYNLLHGGDEHLQARNLAGARLPDDPDLPERAFPGFVLFPQSLNGWDINSAQDVIRLVRLLSKKYKIDPDRIYVHGLSNGGIATYDVMKRAPWMFAAALPMSAPTESTIISKGLIPTVSHIPLWIFQGGIDANPTPARTRGYVKSFRDAGAIVRYSEYSNLGHGVWNTAYAEPDFFSWILGQNKAEIHLYGGVSSICESTGQGVRMALAEGFYHYEWERNGTVMPEATGARYTATTAGTYRARFSRKKNPGPSDWNQWSSSIVVTSQSTAQAEMTQMGTVVLKGLDNYGYAHLKAEGNFAHYYWYKNDVLQNLPGSQDDTTRYVKFNAGDCTSGYCTGNGLYTLIVAGPDNCPSARSEGKYIFFNNQAPVNITAPADFTGSPLPNAEVTLAWEDAAADENGFEIWRRRQTSATTYTPWVMAPLIGPNAVTFVDKGLIPASTYQYKIRAVGNSGRSVYTPSASNQFLVITTSADDQPPATPQNLTAMATGIREIKLQWSPSTDNTGIKGYHIYYGSTVISTGSQGTTHTLTDLPLNTHFTFTVKAVDLADNLSTASNEASESTFMNGLYYRHTTGSFSDIDLIDWSMAEFEGKVSDFSLAPRTQEDYFNFQYEGYLYIQTRGSYRFQTYSDDGSRVTIDGVMTVDNDGLHGPRTISGTTLTLSKGPHLIDVKYFEATGEQTLIVRYRGPDTRNKWVTIPDDALRSGNLSASSRLNTLTASASEKEIINAEDEQLHGLHQNMNIYPNPSRPADNLMVHITGSHEPVNMRLMDLMGKLYYKKTVSGDHFAFQITPYEPLVKGIYVMVFNQGSKTMKQKVIVKE